MLNIISYNNRDQLAKKIRAAAFDRSKLYQRELSCGRTRDDINEEIAELMIIHNFLPYFCAEDLESQKCYLRNKYKLK